MNGAAVAGDRGAYFRFHLLRLLLVSRFLLCIPLVLTICMCTGQCGQRIGIRVLYFFYRCTARFFTSPCETLLYGTGTKYKRDCDNWNNVVASSRAANMIKYCE